jgi:hypothetical protein
MVGNDKLTPSQPTPDSRELEALSMTSYPTRQARVVPFMTFPGRECTSREPEKTSSMAGSRHVLGEADEITVTGQFVIIYQMDAIRTHTNYRSFRDGYSPVI